MKSNFGSEIGARVSQARKSEQGRAAIVALCLAVILGAALAYWLVAKRATGAALATQGSLQSQSAGQSKPATSSHSASSQASAPVSTPETAKTEPGQSASQLVASLAQLQPGKEPLTQERADAWKQSLQQLAQQRAAAVPAIRDFLQKNADITFDSEADRNLVGVPSLRVALLQILQSIGGPEALAVSLQTLKTAADPVEIATLAMSVEQAEPGKHGEEILGAAREALSQAAAGKLEGRDVAPLMAVLKQFDGPDAPADFQKLCGNWFLYTPMLLAQLPDGVGVSALFAWAKNPDSSSMTGNDMYLRVLAQVASQRPDALDVLVEQATSNRIPNSAWNGIAAALGGATLDLANPIIGSTSPSASPLNTRRFHIAAGNQNFIELPPPEDMTSLQAGDRVRMLDRMLGATTNPTALQALQKVRVEVAAKIK